MKTVVLVSIWSISTMAIDIFSMIIIYLKDSIRTIQIICCAFIFVISLNLAAIYMLIIRKIFRQAVPEAGTEVHSQLKRNHWRSIKSQGKATITNCSLMTLSFIISTYPFAIDLLRLASAVAGLSVILLVFHAFLNLMIYFFANYIRRCYCSRAPRPSQ